MLEEFLTVSKDLKFNIKTHFGDILDGNGQVSRPSTEMHDAEAPSDYPTKPSQIPFPPSGMLFLYAAQQFSFHTESVLKPHNENTLVSLSRVYHFFRSPQNTSYLHASFATEDALLSLLYIAKDQSQPVNAAFDFKTLFMSLATFCAEFPDPLLRDAAHSTTTALFHNCPDVKTKISLVTEILKHSTSPANLKAVAIGWVKDELSRPTIRKASGGTPTEITSADLDSNPAILGLLFPGKNAPSISPSDFGKYDLAELPCYIASLNLVFVMASDTTASRPRSAMTAAVTSLEAWRAAQRGLEDESNQNDESWNIKEAYYECRMDLWALDDALGRASKAIELHSPVDVADNSDAVVRDAESGRQHE